MQVENTEDLTGPSGTHRRVKIAQVRSPKCCMVFVAGPHISCSTVRKLSACIVRGLQYYSSCAVCTFLRRCVCASASAAVWLYSWPRGVRELLELLQAAKGPGDDVRAVGSDIRAGEVVLPEGTVIGAAEVGLLATVGAANLKVGCLL